MYPTEAFIEYLKYERNYSDRTVTSYREDLEQFRSYVDGLKDGESGAADVNSGVIRGWAMQLMDEGYAATSINRKLSALRTFYKFLLKKGVISADPTRKVVGPKNSKPLPVFVKEKDMDRLLDNVNFGDDFRGVRNHLIIEMFYETGMRLSELVGLNLADVDFSASVIKVTGKRNKQRLIPFYKELSEGMTQYLKLRDGLEGIGGSEAFFVMDDGRRITRAEVTKTVKEALSTVSTLKKKSPHVLRHTFATAMLNHNAELGAIKELLGHESLKTTEVYTHTTFEELRKVYKHAHPRA